MHTLVVIDAAVADLDSLLTALPAIAEVLVLDAETDGVKQIVRAMDGRFGFEALHIISHGTSGALQLGSALVDAAYLTQNPEPWARIGQALSQQGDILLYGCNVAAGVTGQAFVDHLAMISGADVAASDDLSGNIAAGNWVLEYQTGDLEAESAGVVLEGNGQDGSNYDIYAQRFTSEGAPFESSPSNNETLGRIIIPVGKGNDFACSLIVQADGKLVVAGQSDSSTPATEDFSLVRLNLDGSLDVSFDGGKVIMPVASEDSRDFGEVVLQQADGALAMAGYFMNGSNGYDIAVSLFKANGSLIGKKIISIADGYAFDAAYSMIQQADGKLVTAGSSENGFNGSDFSLVRLNIDGTLDESFGNGGKLLIPIAIGSGFDSAYSVVQQADGKLVVAGQSDNGVSGMDFSLVRLNSNGTLDSSFGNSGKVLVPIASGSGRDEAFRVIQQADGKLVVAGTSEDQMSLIRINANGSLDSSFGSGGKLLIPKIGMFGDCLTDMIEQADGKFVLAGVGFNGNPSSDFIVVRLDVNGTMDSSFGVGGKVVIPDEGLGAYNRIVQQTDGKLVLSYSVENNLGDWDFSLLRLNPDGSVDATFGASVIKGTVDNDILVGTTGNDILQGFAGNDTITGGLGNDTLDGGTGNDSMIGGAGNDTYMVDSIGDHVSETSTLSTEIDTVQSSVTWTLGVNLENLTLTGTGAINGTGNTLNNKIIGNAANNALNGGSGNDTLVGGAGNDALNGSSGSDSMAGGAGNDSYYVDATGDIVAEAAGAGTDTVFSYLGSYILPGNVENGRIMSTSAANLTGNTLNNTLYAGIGNNLLQGGAGIDTVSYAYGVSGTSGVTVNLAVTTAQATSGSGSDTLGSIENVTGSAKADRLTGNSGNNVLNGGSGNDTLNGGAGNDVLDGGVGSDTMYGGTGNDIYVVDSVGDIVSETSTLSTEIDTVQSSVTWTLGVNLENLTLTGTGAINGTGNTLNNKIIGNAANNALNGGSGNDTLLGGTGNDTLNGGAGNDSMAGGAGNDSYYVDATGDIVAEAAGAGTDTVFSYLGSYILPGNVENGRIMSTSVANLTGNTLNNTLYAGGGNNILQGGAGIDMVSYTYGVSGTMGVTVNLGVATAQATGGSGGDTLGGIENVVGSDNADRLTGDSGNNVLNGGAGNDTLLGSGGNDNLCGSTGNDSTTGGAGSDSFTFNSALGSSNIDIITDFAHGTDKIVLDDDIFTQIGAPGTLLAGAFRKGAGVTTAGDADDRIILNTTTGALYYDANGSAAGAAVHFATLSGTSTRATVTASDFLVVA